MASPALGAMAPTPRLAPAVAVERCPLCGNKGQPLHAGVHDYFFGAPGAWSLSNCRDAACGLTWQNPMVVAEDLGADRLLRRPASEELVVLVRKPPLER